MKSPDDLRHSFYLLQIFVGLTSVGIAWLVFRSTQSGSGFKVREADRKRSSRKIDPNAPRLENQTLKKNAKTVGKPLQLPGFRMDGAPHEILGVRADATVNEIQEAYLGLIKRFHPDKIGPPGSREWTDAQKIAATLNEARRVMLEKAKSS